ncbi:MAG: hypothetical protein QME16_00165 [Planctomycetota bacterium]|nr:hypothetical protein [Planctomycetota bacterium]
METMEENGNGKIEKPEAPQFNQLIKIFFNDKTGEYGFETNVSNAIIGYGMLEFAKKGVDNHIARKQASAIQPARGGILNFVRGKQ